MLLVLDIGNTETEVGLFRLREDGTVTPELAAQWRISTLQKQTADEYGVLIRQLFAMQGLELDAVHGIIVASVVPPLESLAAADVRALFPRARRCSSSRASRRGCRCTTTIPPRSAPTAL